MPRYGKLARLWCGQADDVIDFTNSIAGTMTLVFSANVRSEPIGDIFRQYPISATRTLSFDRYLLETEGKGERLADFLAQWGVSATQLGELVLDLSPMGLARIVWFREPIHSAVTVTMPFDDLVNLSGPLAARNPWAGVAAAEEELSSTNLIGEDATQITWKGQGASAAAAGAGGLGMLTTTRAGDAALALETKRGAGAWTANAAADAALAAGQSTSGSVVSLDATVADLRLDDLIRVRFPSGTAAGNTWAGKLIAAYPADLD